MPKIKESENGDYHPKSHCAGGGTRGGWAKFRGGMPILPKMPKMLKMARNGPKTNNMGLKFFFALRAKKLRGYLKIL